MKACMCACMMYVHTYASSVYVHTDIQCIHECTHVHTYSHWLYVHACTHTHPYTQTRLSMCAHTCTRQHYTRRTQYKTQPEK